MTQGKSDSPWLSRAIGIISTLSAGIFGTAYFATSGRHGDSRPDTRPVMIGAQNVHSDGDRSEAHRLKRLRGPLYDFFGIDPMDAEETPVKSSQSGVTINIDVHFPAEDQASLEKSKSKAAGILEESLRLKDGKLKEELQNYELEFLILTVADPIDSVENYRFDHQVDALQKALSADPGDSWLYSGGYLPWQAYKDHRSAGDKTPLLRQKHWYQDEPGVLLFRHEPDVHIDAGRACDCREDGNRCRLLLVYLVGELPTLGLQRDAFDHAIREVMTFSRRQQCSPSHGFAKEQPVRIVGPTFTGSAFSLRESLQTAKSYNIKTEIVIGSATAVENEYFGKSCKAITVCSFEATRRTIHEQPSIRDKRIAWLVETGTAFGAQQDTGLTDKSGSSQDKQPTPSPLCDENNKAHKTRESLELSSATSATLNDTVFPFPVGIARVRADFESRLSDARNARTSLQSIQTTSPLPFDANETALDVPPTQTPQMTVPSVELILDQIAQTIVARRIQFVAIMATDVRDTIFLAELIRLRCPGIQLLILEPDILFTHTEYNSSLRGAIVASSYPLFPEGLEACIEPGKRVPVIGSQTNYGIYNAILMQRWLARVHRECKPSSDARRFMAGMKVVSQKGANRGSNSVKMKAPHVWLQTIGYDRYYPLSVASDHEYKPLELSHVGKTGENTIGSSSVTEARDKWHHYATLMPCHNQENRFDVHFRWLDWLPVCLGLGGVCGAFIVGVRQPANKNGGPLSTWGYDHCRLPIIFMACTLAAVFLSLLNVLSVICSKVDSLSMAYIMETRIFSGLSLLLPMTCAAAAVVFMSYMKLKQRHVIMRTKKANAIQQPYKSEIRRLRKSCWSRVVGGQRRIAVPLGIMAIGFTLLYVAMFQATIDLSGRPILFVVTLLLICIGYAMWWLAAIETDQMVRELRECVKVKLRDGPKDFYRKHVFKELHESGFSSVSKMLLRPPPNEKDPGFRRLYRTEDFGDALDFFRVVQYRFYAIKCQLTLLIWSGLALLFASVGYPFSSDWLLVPFATLTLLTLVVCTSIGYWKLETDEYLCEMLGGKPDEIDWDWNTIWGLGTSLLLASTVVVVNFVPGAWAWIGKFVGALAGGGH